MTTYRVLLPHPLEPRLLMMHTHGEWRLPEWDEATPYPWQVTDHVNRAVAARFGMETTVLRCVSARPDAAGHELRIYELENHSAPHDMIPASTWIGRGEVPVLPIADPGTRELIADWFGREAGELPVLGPPWMRRGWYVEALAWAAARLREHGMTMDTAPEQLRSWERSFVMRLSGDQGTCYFKAVPSVSAHEPRLVHWLAREYPDHFPDVLATDAARGWFLERAVADAVPLAEMREEEEWYRAVRRLAEIQVDCSGRTHELSALGCPHRGLETLALRIPRLCDDAPAFLPGEPCGLSLPEIARVAALAPTLLTLCEELASYDVPDSIEHGALVASTVLSSFSGPVYVDWSNSSLSHPFFTVSRLVSDAVTLVPATSRESRRRLRDSYLAPWAALLPQPALVRAFELARVLAPVHQAATAHAELIPASGYRWEVECAVPAAMRLALQLLADSDSPVSITV